MLSQRRLPGDVIEELYQRPADDPVLASAPPGAGVAVVDLASEEAIAAGWPRRLGVRHAALVPCRSGGETRGILMLGSRYDGAFGESVRDALTAIAALLGLVMEGGGPARERDLDATSDVAGAAGGAPQDRSAAADGADDRSRAGSTVAAPPRATMAGRAGAPPESALAADPGILIQVQKTASIGCLASGFERDFNNTIGAIMGHASHIRALVPDHNPVHDKAAVIEEQSYRAADLVRRLLTFSRGGVGRREPVDINTLVDETIALLARTLDPVVVLESRCASDLPPVDVDAGAMRQVLLNLAVNARDAMPDGGRVVFETRAGHLDAGAVAALPGLAPGDYISVVVSDNGAGMAAEVLEHAFEAFYTTKPVTQGSGLGLAVSYDIVRDHGGHIALSSAPGIGTAARLYLPVAGGSAGRTLMGRGAAQAASTEPGAGLAPAVGGAAHPQGSGGGMAFAESIGPMGAAAPVESGAPAGPSEAMAGMSPGAPPEAAGGGALADAGGHGPLPETLPWLRTCPFTGEAKGRILVVDDEQVLRAMMAEMLKSRGYEVVTARDGVEALEIYRKEWGRIDLVVVDLIMPRLGGLETFRRITGMNRDARVLLCSGSTHHRQAQQAIEEGALGLLPKPFGMSELAGWIEKGLAK
jgi:signal transduction histidine kinase